GIRDDLVTGVQTCALPICAHVTAGGPVFSLLDTGKWYVIANFREAEVRHMAPGSEAIVYLSSAPNQRFRGKVQGIGWAVKPEGRSEERRVGKGGRSRREPE